MTTYESLLQHPRRPFWTLGLLTLALALLAVLLAAGFDSPLPAEIPAALPVAALSVAPAPPLDHSALRDPERLPEADPSPMSVAAYGD